MNELIIDVIRSLGATGVGLLMFAENLFPPLPSEFIMPLAAYLSTQGKMNLVMVVVAGTIGSLLGALFWYRIGLKVGSQGVRQWIAGHGTWLGLYEDDLDRADRFFQKYGKKAVFFGRLVPVVRTLISVPAGMSHMPFWSFLVFSAVGTVLWNIGLAAAGYTLGQQFPKISTYLGPISWIVIGAALLFYLLRVYRVRRDRRTRRSEEFS